AVSTTPAVIRPSHGCHRASIRRTPGPVSVTRVPVRPAARRDAGVCRGARSGAPHVRCPGAGYDGPSGGRPGRRVLIHRPVGKAMLNKYARAFFTRVLTPFAAFLLRKGVTPDAVTLVGTAGVVAGALAFYPRGQFFWGTVVITLFVFSDLVDGN